MRKINPQPKCICQNRLFTLKPPHIPHIAALFHIFENGPQGEVAFHHMQGAIAIASWHLDETKRIFSTIESSSENTDTLRLREWLIEKETYEFNTAYLAQKSPRGLRKKEQWQPALNTLIDHGYVVPNSNKPNSYYLISSDSRNVTSTASGATCETF